MESTKPTLNLAENGNKSKPLLQAVFFAPYLPYSIKIAYDYFGDTQEFATLIGVEDRNGETRSQVDTGGSALLKYCKLVLKPISDLTIEFINNDVVLREFQPEFIISNRYEWSYAFVQRLFELHIDYFGLIEKGLAISIHDVV